MIGDADDLKSLTDGDRLTENGIVAVEAQLLHQRIHNCSMCDAERPWKVTDRLCTISLGDTTTKAISLVCRDCGALQTVSLAHFLRRRAALGAAITPQYAEDAGQEQTR